MPIDRFVANVFRRESGPERSAWVTNFALTLADTGDDEFANELKQNALDDMAANRQRQERFRKRKQQQLTAVRVSGSGDAPAPVTSEAISSPDGTDELYAFAAANDLDEIDAREWYEMSEKRGWKDRYGNPIRDWELACEAYCARKALNRLKKEAK